MVVPVLTCHENRHAERCESYSGCRNDALQFHSAEQVNDGSNSDTAPYCKSIERTSISIVALTRLQRSLVKVDNDGKTSHEEEEEYHPELADAHRVNLLLRLSVNSHLTLALVECLPE